MKADLPKLSGQHVTIYRYELLRSQNPAKIIKSIWIQLQVKLMIIIKKTTFIIKKIKKIYSD